MEKYIVNGQGFNVKLEDLDLFMQKFPNAKKYISGKTDDFAIADPMAESNVMGFDLDNGFLAQQEDEEERSALDILKSYPASFYLRGTEMINNFVKSYETGESPSAVGRVAVEIAMENPFVAAYGYAAEYLRGKGYDIPKEFIGMDLTTPKERREIYENFMLDAREKGIPLEKAQRLDPTNKIKFEDTIDFFQKHTYQPKDKEGKPIDYMALWSEGKILEGTDAFLNEAAGAIPSLLVSRSPYGTGAAVIGVGAYMDNFEREMYKRGFNDETTRSQVVNDSMITGGSDFVTEFIGGRIINKLAKSGLGKDAVKELLTTSVPMAMLKKFGLGYLSEFVTEGAAGVISERSDKWVYDDVVTYQQSLRTFFKDGFLGGFLGGPAVAMSTANKSQIYEYVADSQYKQTQLGIEQQIIALTRDLDQAEGNQKETIQKKIDSLKQEKQKNKENNYAFFDNMTQKQKENWASNIDKQNEALDLIYGKNSEETKKQAKEDYEKAVKANEKFFNGLKRNYDPEVEAIIGKQIRAYQEIQKQRGVFGFNKDKLNVKFVENEAEIEALENKFKGFKRADGIFYDDSEGKPTIYINSQVAAATSQTNVLGHEYLHAIVSRAFSEGIGKSALKNSVSSFVKYLNDIGQSDLVADIEAKIAVNYDGLDQDGDIIRDVDGLVKTKKAKDQEEYFNIFSDLIKDNKIEAVENKSSGIKNSFRALHRGLGFGSVDFQNGQEVFDFLVDYNTNMNRASKLGKLTSRGIAGVKMKGLEPKKDKRFKKGTDTLKEEIIKKSVSVERRNQISSSVQEIGSTYSFEGGKKAWDEGGADQAITEIKTNNYLDDLIAAKYKADRVPVDFVDKVYAELTSHIKNFNPETNDNLFGWINSQLANKAGNVYNREYKQVEQEKTSKDVDDRTKEGEVKVQVAAEVDPTLEALETEDISPAAQARKAAEKAKPKIQKESEFRKAIGIETDSKIYNEVLDGARKALLRAYEAGTSVRNIQRKLRDEANVYLFKTVKNFLGTKDYVNNLKKFREPIMKVMFTSDLVQLERNVPQDERVFTKFVKKLTSKQEVQDAVNQKLLPPEALNIIDKGTAVSLYEKKNVSEASFMSFFDIPAFNPVTKQRSGKRGTRKDQLAKYMAGALSYDATMQVAQEPDVMQRRADLAGLKGETLAKDNLQVLATEIGRNPNIKFSINQEQVVQGIDIIFGKDKNDGFGGKNWQKYYDNKNISNETKYAAQEEFLNRLTEENDAISQEELDKLDRFKNGKKRKTKIRTYKKYEIIAKQRAEKILSNLGLDKQGYNVENLSEKDNNPDIRITKNGKTAFTIEIKGNTARGVSVSFNYKQDVKRLVKGKKAAEKQETENYNKQEKSLIEFSNKIFEKMIKLVGPSEVTYSKFKNLQISVEGYNKIIEKGLQLEIHGKQFFITTSDFANSYMQKKGKDGSSRTSNAIDIGNAGMFLMDNNSIMQVEGLNNFSDQKVLIPLTARINFGRVNKAGTHRTVSIRVEPQINSVFFDKQNISLINKSGNKNFKIKESLTKEVGTGRNLFKASISDMSKSNGASIFDFDETVGISENFVIAKKDDITEKIPSYEWPLVGENLKEQGYEFDFTDFNKVTKGKPGPLLQKMKNQIEKYGSKNVFILTARAPESAVAIHEWLQSEGVNIPLENVTGLGNSTGEAKATWILDKYAEKGYNDIYFVDDALQNVQAVKNMFDQLDIKGKSVQAKVKFSKSMNDDFNNILEEVTGIEAEKRFMQTKARKRGANKGKFRFFIPPSHEDFTGLLYNFMGKGKQGDGHRDFFEKALIRPLNRAYREIDTAKQAIANDYKALNKKFPDIKKKLRKKTPDGDFIIEDAIRIYLWNKHGYNIEGLSDIDKSDLVELVMNDSQLREYAETVNIISKQDTYVEPGKGWEGGNIQTDLIDATGRVGRAEYFKEFNENAEILFSEENLNKIEAGYGADFRSALEDMLHRIKTGVNRPKGQHATVNKLMNYLNGSVGTVMFFNVRSAILQQMSIVNYINFADNNIFAAAKAFANQKQYWKDFAFIFNSDMLKQRRGGIGTDINGADLAQAVKGSKEPTKVVISRLLKLGFLPTQIGDNIAIATGGATFYRNRVNKYIKDGLSQKEAETKAFTDFQDLTQSTQQSSRPDMTSQQQASWIGKLILNFQNITSQYNRIIKKAALDIGKGRISPPYTTKAQSNLGNLSKILYYGGIQNVLFYSLQTALFAIMFDDEKDEDQILKKRERVIQGTIDSILRGSGIYGAVVSTLKNAVRKWKEQREKGYNKDESGVLMELLNFSPVVGIKSRMIVNAEKTLNYNENVISEMETFDADNPMWSSVTNYTQALTNFPANRLYQKSINMRNALDKDYTNFQRIMFFSGYTTWSLGLGDAEAVVEAKEKAKINKQNTKKKKKRQNVYSLD